MKTAVSALALSACLAWVAGIAIPTAQAQQYHLLPPLPAGLDPTQATAQQRDTYGIPEPPPTEDALATAVWLRHVTHMNNRVTSAIGVDTSHKFGPAKGINFQTGTTPNWSGFVDLLPTYHATPQVMEEFTVPAVPCGSDTISAWAVWPGFGGWGSDWALQSGVDVVALPGPCGTPTGSIPFAWIEYYPDYPINLYLVNPGDSMSVIVEHKTKGLPGFASIVDFTINKSAAVRYSCTTCASDPYTGNSVEWIIEAPSSGQFILPLAAYGQVTITHAFMAQSLTDAVLRYPYDHPKTSSFNVMMEQSVDQSGVITSSCDTPESKYTFNCQSYPND
jgi:Peptidase A4 family